MAKFLKIESKDALNTGRIKLNNAIDGSEQAVDRSIDADNKATQALANSKSTQTQLDTIVINGDSSVEAAQARVDEKGAPHPTLKDRIDDGFNKTSTQLAQTKQYTSHVLEKDIAYIKGKTNNGEKLKFCVLGDSTEAGRTAGPNGSRNSTYGELGDKRYPTTWERHIMNLFFSSPFYLPFRDVENRGTLTGGVELSGLYASGTSNPAGNIPDLIWNHLEVIRQPNETPLFAFNYKHNLRNKKNKLTVAYLTRTASSAPTFDIVSGGVTTTVNTYKDPVTFGTVGSFPQDGFDIDFVEVPISSTGDTFDFTIGNVKHREDVNTSTVFIIGFYYGESPQFKNYAVSTTTLKNTSIGNEMRGVTTDERFQKAFTYNPDVYVIGWGSNDARPSYNHSLQDYEVALNSRITQIRNHNPKAIIFLDSAGDGEGEFIDNRLYFDVMFKVAKERNCNFVPVGEILRSFNRSEVMHDYVHQNQYGYNVVADYLGTLFSIDNFHTLMDKHGESKSGVEEWTPSLHTTTSAGTPSYSVRQATYHKDGKMVYISIILSVNSYSGASGDWVITGLPFKAVSQPTLLSTLTTLDNVAMFRTEGSLLRARTIAGNNGVPATDFSSVKYIYVSGVYITE